MCFSHISQCLRKLLSVSLWLNHRGENGYSGRGRPKVASVCIASAISLTDLRSDHCARARSLWLSFTCMNSQMRRNLAMMSSCVIGGPKFNPFLVCVSFVVSPPELSRTVILTIPYGYSGLTETVIFCIRLLTAGS